MQKIVKQVDYLGYLGEYTKSILIKLDNSEDKFVQIAPGIDTEYFSPRPKNQKLILKHRLDQRRVIVSVGRLVHRKGQDQLIEALPKVLLKYPDAVLLFVGDGPIKSMLQNSARQLGVTNSIAFTGKVSHNDLPDYISLGEILVLISAFIYGAHFVALGEWSDGKNTYALTLIQVVTVAVLTSIFAFRDGFQIAPDSTVWLAILYTAFFATFLGFLVQTKAQSVMSATVASVLLATETPFAVFFGLYFHDDPLTLRIITGGLLVMAAMALVIWSDNKKTSMRALSHE